MLKRHKLARASCQTRPAGRTTPHIHRDTEPPPAEDINSTTQIDCFLLFPKPLTHQGFILFSAAAPFLSWLVILLIIIRYCVLIVRLKYLEFRTFLFDCDLTQKLKIV